MNKPAGWNWRKMGLAIAILAGLYASYAVLFQKDPLGSQHQTKSYIEHEKRTCMEVSIYVSDPSQIGSEQVAWYGYPYWMIITQAREKMRDLGPNSPIMNHRLLVAFMTRADAEGFVKATYPTAIVCGEMTPRSDTYELAIIARSYQKRDWRTEPPNQ
jgi:hypothetical protein